MTSAISLFRLTIVFCVLLLTAPALAQTVPAAAEQDNVTLNFPGVDIHQAAKAVLADILGLNYAVDPAVQGVITLETTRPVSKAEVLSLFETALKTSNLALVQNAGTYVVVPLADARRQGHFVGRNDAGYGSESIQLHYVGAAELKKLIDPLVPDNAISQIDEGQNVLVVTGTSVERKAVRDLAAQFDVNWLRGMSVAVYVPHHTDSKMLVPQLELLLNAPGSPTAGRIRFVSLDRANAILAISQQPQFLEDVRRMIDKLDAASESNEPRLFVYRVQNGRATDLAGVLAKAFGEGAGTPSTLRGRQTTSQLANAPSPSIGISASTIGATTAPTDSLGSVGAMQPVGTSQTIQIGNTPSPVTLTSDETNNSLVIYATEHQYSIIEDALKKLDIVPLQVMIEAVVTEVTLNDALQYGTQWTLPTVTGQFNFGNHGASSLGPAVPGFSYLLSNSNSVNASGSSITAALTALASVTTIKVDSAPKLLVLNNQTATLQVGDQVPVATASAISTETSNAPIVNSIQYLDTGVILKITPRVNDSGLVLLDISQEVSGVSNTTSSNLDSPTIQQRKIMSSVAVQNGQTVALGGLITDNVSNTDAGIPYLNKIPFLGSTLFGGVNDSHQRTELIVLLTPHVVRNAQDAQTVTDEVRDKMLGMIPLSKAGKP